MFDALLNLFAIAGLFFLLTLPGIALGFQLWKREILK